MARTNLVAAVLLVAMFIAAVDAQTASIKQRKEKRILDCKIESQDFADCNPMGYVTRVIVVAAPGIIVAALVLLACPLYCGGKYCCNCCGGRHQSPNCCFPNNDMSARYTTGDIIRPKVLALCCVLACAAAFIWGMVGAGSLTSGLLSFNDEIYKVPGILTREIDAIETKLTVVRYDATTNTNSTVSLLNTTGNATKTAALASRDKLRDQIEGNMAGFTERVDQLQWILYIIFIVPTACTILGFLASLLSCRKFFPMILVWILFLFGVITWLGHGAFAGSSMIAADACAEVRALVKKQLNLIPVVIQCKDSQFTDFKSKFQDLSASETSSVCDGIANMCYVNSSTPQANVAAGRVYSCPQTLSTECSTMAFGRLQDVMEVSVFVHPNVVNLPEAAPYVCATPANKNVCTIAKCASDCTNATNGGALTAGGRSSAAVYFNYLAAKAVSNAIDTVAARFASCDSVSMLMLAAFEPPCDKITTGLAHERQASGILGLAIIGAIFIFAWGAKRFIPTAESDLAQPKEIDSKVEQA